MPFIKYRGEYPLRNHVFAVLASMVNDAAIIAIFIWAIKTNSLWPLLIGFVAYYLVGATYLYYMHQWRIDVADDDWGWGMTAIMAIFWGWVYLPMEIKEGSLWRKPVKR